jgi:hypothetical protein
MPMVRFGGEIEAVLPRESKAIKTQNSRQYSAFYFIARVRLVAVLAATAGVGAGAPARRQAGTSTRA